MIQPQIKGYNLSTDYKKLFELIHQGYKIPAWIVCNNVAGHSNIIRLVEVRLTTYKKIYSIGRPGISYDSYDSTFEQFEIDCKKYSLKYIEPAQP